MELLKLGQKVFETGQKIGEKYDAINDLLGKKQDETPGFFQSTFGTNPKFINPDGSTSYTRAYDSSYYTNPQRQQWFNIYASNPDSFTSMYYKNQPKSIAYDVNIPKVLDKTVDIGTDLVTLI